MNKGPGIPAEKQKVIDLKRVFTNKSPRFARFIPRFVLRYLERVAHQDDLNEFLDQHGHKRDAEFMDAILEDFDVTVDVKGTENLPPEGRFIIAANHPLGGFDGIILMKIISDHYAEFRFLVNDILMNVYPFKGLFIPINKLGKQAMIAMRQIEEAYASDMQILTFPAGLVSRRIKGQIMDLRWQKSFIVKSVKYKRDIIPVHFSGRNTNFFYNLANFRKFLGIKANLEMLYLVDETYKHKHKTFTITIGKPIPYTTFDKSRKPIEWAKWVKERAYALGGITRVPL